MRLLRIRSTGPATRLIRVMRSCFHTLLIWRDPTFLRSGVRIGAIHHCHMVMMDASMTGWGAVFEGRQAHGVWTGEFLSPGSSPGTYTFLYQLRAIFLALIHFLPLLRRCHVIVRTDNVAVISHINWQGGSRLHTLNRLARHLLPESGSRSGSFEPCSRFSVEAETQARRMDAEPSGSSPDLGSAQRSGSWPLCIKGVVPMPALVLPEFPGTSGHRRVRPSLAERETVRASASQANSGSPVQGEGEWCPSPTRSPILAISDVVLRADSSSVSAPWESLIRQDLLSQLQGKIWHPQPEIWKLCVWPIQGH